MSEKTTALQPIVVHDDGPLAHFLDTGKFTQLQRIARMFSESNLVPEHYRGPQNIANCMIAVEMAARMEQAPLMFMQSSYIVHGKPGMEAKMAIALVNTSGLFDGPLEYERVGDDAHDKSYRVRAVAYRGKKQIAGPWVDWKMVEAEGWDKKSGSKWKTIPGLMFDYRAAAFFARTVCPERLMGMQTIEELEDVGGGTLAPVSEARGEKIVDQIQLKNAKVEEAQQVEPKEEAKDETETESSGDPLPATEMRDQIVELLGQHCDGDQAEMDAVFAKIVEAEFGESGVSTRQIAELDPGALPLVLEAVETALKDRVA